MTIKTSTGIAPTRSLDVGAAPAAADLCWRRRPGHPDGGDAGGQLYQYSVKLEKQGPGRGSIPFGGVAPPLLRLVNRTQGASAPGTPLFKFDRALAHVGAAFFGTAGGPSWARYTGDDRQRRDRQRPRWRGRVFSPRCRRGHSRGPGRRRLWQWPLDDSGHPGRAGRGLWTGGQSVRRMKTPLVERSSRRAERDARAVPHLPFAVLPRLDGVRKPHDLRSLSAAAKWASWSACALPNAGRAVKRWT